MVQLNTASCEPCCSPGLAFSPPAATSNIPTVRKHFTQSVFNAPTFFTVVWSWISRCAVLFSSALVSALRWLNLRFHLIRAPATRYASLMPALGQPSSLFLVSVSHRRQSATRVASGSSMCTFFFLSFVYPPKLTFVSFPLLLARNNHRWPRTVAFVYPSPRSSSHTSSLPATTPEQQLSIQSIELRAKANQQPCIATNDCHSSTASAF